MRGDEPSGDIGTIYEYVRFDPDARAGIAEYLAANGVESSDPGDGTTHFTYSVTISEASGKIEQHWFVGDDWLGATIGHALPGDPSVSPFVGDLTSAMNADFLPEDRRAPMCSTFFGTFNTEGWGLPIGGGITGFEVADVGGSASTTVTENYPAGGGELGCSSFDWHPASPEEISSATASLGEPVETTDHGSKVYEATDLTYVVALEQGYITGVASRDLAKRLLEPDLTFRPLETP